MQTKIFVYSKNRIFPKNPIFLKILCPKIYGTLLISIDMILRSAKIKRSGFWAVGLLILTERKSHILYPSFLQVQRLRNACVFQT